jgi:energy-coupling factor transporter ATP-binding protein EcfA2
MQLIKSLEIEGFRSIQYAHLREIGEYNSLVGRNSSGKSNVLRALNLFFNERIEPSKLLVFSRDVYDEVPRPKRKKRILISANFLLPHNFKFRKELSHLRSLGQQFTIKRAWELNERREVIPSISLTSEGQAVPNGNLLAQQFLGLITYRYIPNRSVPAELLRDESQAIASSLFMRMKGEQHAENLLASLNVAAHRLLQEAATSLDSSGSPLTNPSMATAKTIGEMLRMSGFQARGRHGGLVQDEDWGAGHQAFFLYEVLRAIDTSFSRQFGWRQAAIWGVEEPESALHRDLETLLADKLRKWALGRDSRLQIIQTTHSPIFTMASDSGFWVELLGKRSDFKPLPIPELVRASETRGVSGWVHPVLAFPWNPVVLVEGEIDMKVLTHVARIVGLFHLRIFHLPSLDRNERGGGKDAIIKYIKANAPLIKNRPKAAPLIVLLDWDVSDQELRNARNAYGDLGERFVMKMDARHCEITLGDSFKGIERFYPSEILLAAHQADELVLGIREGRPYSIAVGELQRGKRRLLDRLEQVDSVDRFQPLVKVLSDIEAAFRGTSVQFIIPTIAPSGPF